MLRNAQSSRPSALSRTLSNQITLRLMLLAKQCTCVFLVCMGCAIARAQSQSPDDAQNNSKNTYKFPDRDVAVPVSTGVLGVKDGAALNEIIAHLKVVGVSPWTGMQGTGQIVYNSGPTSYSATLTIAGNTGFRLDGQTSSGVFSIRINNGAGSIQEADGRKYPILPDTAASGIFQFQLPRLSGFPDLSASLIDHGFSLVEGTTLHRMTFEFPTDPPEENQQKRRTVATDFYFDGTTHFLVKSANLIRINGAGNHDFLRVITYEDYRKVGDSMVPFRYTQTLSGQKQWTLQLSDVQLNPALDATFFEF